MSSKPSRIISDIDLDADGKQFGFLNIPYSRNDSAWGSIRMPMIVIKNGNGPTILFTGGNHGDEYEGPIGLLKLVRRLEPSRINGRVIVIPALNFPAVQAGTRLSPIDGLNMNRVFPGRREGTVTSMIAHYVYTEVLPLADVVVDIHAGGKSMTLVPCAVIHELEDRAMMERTLAAMRVFGAPLGLVLVELDSDGMLDTAVEEMGKVFISAELGGGGTVTTETVATADRGIHNMLSHFGVLNEPLITREELGLTPTRVMHTPEGNSFVVSDETGIYENLVDLGAEVSIGTPIGRVHFFETPEREHVEYKAERSGTLVCRYTPGLIKRGDCVGVIANDYPTPADG
ncbi:MAG: succinylglutamate desuccinylase/aspartoacylase family protein [Gammaproteobacteria bacterium]|nr:succinylglutamate desuccinylase/aspartoacylase family protein [Gammaproteobacteria bacterium]